MIKLSSAHSGIKKYGIKVWKVWNNKVRYMYFKKITLILIFTILKVRGRIGFLFKIFIFKNENIKILRGKNLKKEKIYISPENLLFLENRITTELNFKL